MAAARASRSASGWPSRLTSSVSCGLPRVRVPVLSKGHGIDVGEALQRGAP